MEETKFPVTEQMEEIKFPVTEIIANGVMKYQPTLLYIASIATLTISDSLVVVLGTVYTVDTAVSSTDSYATDLDSRISPTAQAARRNNFLKKAGTGLTVL